MQPMDEPPAKTWIALTLVYIALVVAVTAFAVWEWPRLGPWIWAHI